jgi:methionyl-tRNA formyltransferase
VTQLLRWPADRPLRSVFMGTPAFALPSVEALAAATDLVGVVSQPDKPRDRGMAPLASPVARAATAHGIPLARLSRLRDPEALATLAAWRPDLIVVAAYGKILPRAILELPALAPINVHASLLPRHRGAAPIAAAILAGDTLTGVTIMLMSEEMDAGDILLQHPLAIEPQDTTATLEARLAALGGRALADALALLRGHGLTPVAQDPALATYAPRLAKDDGRIRWSEPATTIERKVRAFTPWPSAFTALGGQMVKILRARVVADGGRAPAGGAAQSGAVPGTIAALGETIRVATGAGMIDLLTVQREGRKALAAPAFVSGARLVVGTRFDD